MMLEANALGCVRGDRRLFSQVSFQLGAGSLLQVQGPNGSGKTSLLRMICGLLQPAEGEIRWQGKTIQSIGEDYFADLAYVGHRNGLKEELSSMENLSISSGLAGFAAGREECATILQSMGLAGREHLPARLLSEGQRRRSSLARLLVTRKPLWLLDEVFTSLDSAAVGMLKKLIGDHLSGGGIAVVATHQELDIRAGSFQRLELAS